VFLCSLVLAAVSASWCTTDSPVNQYSKRAIPRNIAPAWKAMAVVDEKFEKISLQDYLGKWIVLLFYPFDFTYVCPTEILGFSERNNEFKEINTQVLAISTDSHHTHLAWIRTSRREGGLEKLNIPLVADISKNIAHSYGVLVEDENDPMYGAALRGVFLIDPEGYIRSVQVNDDMVGRNVDEMIRMLKAFQYARKHPSEVCPANWTPGKPTIKADPNLKKEFFREQNKEKDITTKDL